MCVHYIGHVSTCSSQMLYREASLFLNVHHLTTLDIPISMSYVFAVSDYEILIRYVYIHMPSDKCI